jgi:hypothetical protein
LWYLHVAFNGEDVTVTAVDVKAGPSPQFMNVIVGALSDLEGFDRGVRSQIPQLTDAYKLTSIDEDDDLSLSLEYDDEVAGDVIFVTVKNGQATMDTDDEDESDDDFN